MAMDDNDKVAAGSMAHPITAMYGLSHFGGKATTKVDKALDPDVAKYQAFGGSDATRGLIQQQTAQAQQFRANLPNYQKEQYASAENAGRRALATKLQDVKTGASQRGLLHSGLRQGEESRIGADSAGRLAGQRADINLQSEDMAQEMENEAIQSGLQYQKMMQDLADEEYNKNMEIEQQRKGSIGGMTRGLGTSVAGIFK